MTQATTRASVTSQTIAVAHIRISSGRSFAEERRRLEDTVPKLDTGIAEALRSGDRSAFTVRVCPSVILPLSIVLADRSF